MLKVSLQELFGLKILNRNRTPKAMAALIPNCVAIPFNVNWASSFLSLASIQTIKEKKKKKEREEEDESNYLFATNDSELCTKERKRRKQPRKNLFDCV